MKCAVCQSTRLVQSYRVGSVRGQFCAACMDGAGLVLAAWSLQRMREVQHAREVFDAICDEQLPLSTRRSMRERGTA